MLERQLHVSLFGPNHVYVRYRCARCRRVGERYIPEELWSPKLLRPEGDGLNEEQLARFRRMGEITADEIIDFHFALEQLSAEPEGV